jgi:hypothetical protein
MINGKPQFHVVRHNILFNEMDITLEGGFFGWLVNVLSVIFKGPLTEIAQNAMKETLSDIVNREVNELIRTIPFIQPYDHQISIDVHSNSPIFINPDYMYASVFGFFFPSHIHQRPPIGNLLLI